MVKLRLRLLLLATEEIQVHGLHELCHLWRSSSLLLLHLLSTLVLSLRASVLLLSLHPLLLAFVHPSSLHTISPNSLHDQVALLPQTALLQTVVLQHLCLIITDLDQPPDDLHHQPHTVLIGYQLVPHRLNLENMLVVKFLKVVINADHIVVLLLVVRGTEDLIAEIEPHFSLGLDLVPDDQFLLKEFFEGVPPICRDFVPQFLHLNEILELEAMVKLSQEEEELFFILPELLQVEHSLFLLLFEVGVEFERIRDDTYEELVFG